MWLNSKLKQNNRFSYQNTQESSPFIYIYYNFLRRTLQYRDIFYVIPN